MESRDAKSAVNPIEAVYALFVPRMAKEKEDLQVRAKYAVRV